MADFQNGLISRIFSIFWRGFCTQRLEMICRMDFDMFFGILIFDPKWWFCTAYSLCMICDFENGLISWIFHVFWSGFLHTATRIDLKNGFWHVFWNFNFLCGLHEVYSHIMLRPNLYIYLSTRVEGMSRGLLSAILVCKSALIRVFLFWWSYHELVVFA